MQIFFHKQFSKKYCRLDTTLQKKIDARVLLFQREPFAPALNNHPLSGKYKGYYSINVTGDYRALYKVIAEDAVVFWDVDTHENLYG